MKRVITIMIATLALLSWPARADDIPRIPVPMIASHNHSAAINRLEVTGSTIITVSDDKTIRLSDLSSLATQAVIPVPMGFQAEGQLYALATQPDSRLIATGGWTGVEWDQGAFVYLIDRQDKAVIGRLGPFPATISALAFTQDGGRLAIGLGAGAGVWLADLTGSTILGKTPVGDGTVVWMRAETTGRFLALLSSGALLRLDTEARPIQSAQLGASCAPAAAAMVQAPHPVIAVGCTGQARIHVLDATSLREENAIDLSDAVSVQALAAANGSALIAAATAATNGQQNIYAIDLATARPHLLRTLASDTVTDLKSVGSRIIYSSADGSIGALNTTSHKDQLGKRESIDFRDREAQFLAVGEHAIALPLRSDGHPVVFDLLSRVMTAPPPITPPPLKPPLALHNWKNDTTPDFAGIPIALGEREIARAAISLGETTWVLGADYTLRLYENATPRWKTDITAPAWALTSFPTLGLIAAGLGDGSVRFFRIRDGKEVAALFIRQDSESWVAWTPSGYYDAGANGDSLLEYFVNTGKASTPELYQNGQFHRLLFRPDILTQAFQGKQGINDQEMEIARIVETGLPPTIALTELCARPAGHKASHCVAPAQLSTLNATTGYEAVSATIRVTEHAGGFSHVNIRRNGAIINDAATITPLRHDGKDRYFTISFELSAGQNTVSLTGETPQFQVETAPADAVNLSLAGRAQAPQPNFTVITIGINKYQQHRLLNAVSDATSMSKILLNNKIKSYTEFNNTIITDELATKDNIINNLLEQGKRSNPDDLVVIFLAGHGISIDGRYIFVPVDVSDFSESGIRNNGISQADLAKALASFNAAKILVILDTCFAGSFDVSLIDRQSRDRSWVESLSRMSGRFILVGTTNEQEALDGINGQGVFTSVVIDGLKGKADTEVSGDHHGSVNIYELAQYVKEKVPLAAHSVSADHTQTPVYHFTGSDFFEITQTK